MKKLISYAMTLFLGLVLCGGECTPQDAPEVGVEINGVTWATRNVAAFGKFAAKPEDFGMLYQWNRATAYSGINPLTPAWDATAISSTWNSANDPCPAGWTLPTKTDFEKLLDAVKVTMTFPATENGVSGARYTASGKSIFLPQTNSRGGADGTLYMNDGAYRSKTDWNGSTAYSISIGATGIGADSYLNALSIRCVKGAK